MEEVAESREVREAGRRKGKKLQRKKMPRAACKRKIWRKGRKNCQKVKEVKEGKDEREKRQQWNCFKRRSFQIEMSLFNRLHLPAQRYDLPRADEEPGDELPEAAGQGGGGQQDGGEEERKEGHLCLHCPADHQVWRRQLSCSQLPRFNLQQWSEELDRPGNSPQRVRGQGQGGVFHRQHAPAQHDRGVGLPERNDDVQGDGGHLPDGDDERHGRLHLLEQLQLHRTRYNHQGVQDQDVPDGNACPAGQLQVKLLSLQTG